MEPASSKIPVELVSAAPQREPDTDFFGFRFCFVLFCFFVGFKAIPLAYGSFQARSQIRAVATATAMLDPSRVCNLHHSSWQCWILNPLSEARDPTLTLMVPSRIHFCSTTTGSLNLLLLELYV